MEATGGKDLIAHQWDPDIVYEVFGVAEPDAELLKIDVGTGTAGTLCREPDFPPTQIRKMDGTMARVWFLRQLMAVAGCGRLMQKRQTGSPAAFEGA